MPSFSQETSLNRLSGLGIVDGIDLVDLASDDDVEMQQLSNHVNGNASKEIDMIDLSLLDDDAGLTDEGDYLLEDVHLNGGPEWMHDAQPVDFGVPNSSSPEVTSSQSSMEVDDLCLELLKSIGEIKKTKQSESTSEEDDMSYFLGRSARQKGPRSSILRPLGDNANSSPISKPKFMPSLLEHRTENDYQQIERSAKLREANLQRRRNMQLQSESREAEELQAKEEPTLPQRTPSEDTAKSTPDAGVKNDDTELWGSPVPVVEHKEPRLDILSPVTNRQEPSKTIAAETTDSCGEDASGKDAAVENASGENASREDASREDASAKDGSAKEGSAKDGEYRTIVTMITERAKRQEKAAQPKKTRFLGFDRFEPPPRKHIEKPTVNGFGQPTHQLNGLIDCSTPTEIVNRGTTRLESITPVSRDPKSLLRRHALSPDQAKNSSQPDDLRSSSVAQAQNFEGVLPKLPVVSSVKEQKDQITKHLRDLRSIRSTLEVTAKYCCMHVADSKVSGEIEEIRRFTISVLNGEVHDTFSRKRMQDIKDNMKRRTVKDEPELNPEEKAYFAIQTADDKLPNLAAVVLGGTAFFDVVGAIAAAEERHSLLTHQRDIESGRDYRLKHRQRPKSKPKNKPKKPAKISKIDHLDQLLQTYNSAEKTRNIPPTTTADEVIELSDHCESDIELTSDEDETASEYAARKKRKKDDQQRVKNEERAAQAKARLKAEQAQTFEELRRVDYEAQETARGAFNVTKEYPPGFDRKRIFQQHETHFNENKVLEAGVWTAGQGRLPSPSAGVAEGDSDSENVAATAAHYHDAEDDMLIDSASDSDSDISIAEECFEYLVKGQKHDPSSSPSSSSSSSNSSRTYHRTLSLPSAHTHISTLLSRLRISRKDALGGAHLSVQLSPHDLSLVDQSITFLGTGKTVRFWIEKRRVYAQGRVARRAFAPRTVWQVSS
ncbi:MAG: hypothetical protein Q9160_003694 [Pyrenula sp. 1 TL-2023]